MIEKYVLIPFLVLLLIAYFVALAWCIKMLIRNERVYKFRMKIIDEDINLFYKLPPYQEMMHDGKKLVKESYL